MPDIAPTTEPAVFPSISNGDSPFSESGVNKEEALDSTSINDSALLPSFSTGDPLALGSGGLLITPTTDVAISSIFSNGDSLVGDLGPNNDATSVIDSWRGSAGFIDGGGGDGLFNESYFN